METVSTGTIREDRAPVFSPVTPTPRGRNVAPGAEDDVIGDASGVGSQTITLDKPLQPDNDTCGPGSHIEDLHQSQVQSHPHDASNPMPFRISASTGQLADSQDDDPFSHTGFYEAVSAARVEQEPEATGLTDVACQNAVSSPRVDGGQVEDSVVSGVVAPHVIDEKLCERPLEQPLEEPHGELGASTAVSVPNIVVIEPEKKGTPILEAIDEDTQTAPLRHPQNHPLTDVVGKDAVSSSPIDAGLVEESTINNFIAPHLINWEPHGQLHEQEQFHEQHHEEHGASTAAIGPVIMETKPKKEETALLETTNEDMPTVPPPNPQPQQSFGIADARSVSHRRKKVEEWLATTEPASDNDSAAFGRDAPNVLVTIPIPLHYRKVRNYLWFKKSIADAQPAPETRSGPRTPSPKRPPQKAPGTSGARRPRVSKKTPSKAPADDDNSSPHLTRSAKKVAEDVEPAATQAASPPPRATPIKKITLHFTRKPKVETDGDTAPEPEAGEEEESSRESMEVPDEPGVEGGGLYDGCADDLAPDADAEEEVMLL